MSSSEFAHFRNRTCYQLLPKLGVPGTTRDTGDMISWKYRRLFFGPEEKYVSAITCIEGDSDLMPHILDCRLHYLCENQS